MSSLAVPFAYMKVNMMEKVEHWVKAIREMADQIEASGGGIKATDVDIIKNVIFVYSEKFEINGLELEITINGWNSEQFAENMEKLKK